MKGSNFFFHFTGNTLTVDTRNPKQILSTSRLSNRAITKFAFKGTSQFGIVSKSKTAKIFEISENSEFNLLHEHSAPDVIIYDFIWDKNDEKTFYVVGDAMFARKVQLN